MTDLKFWCDEFKLDNVTTRGVMFWKKNGISKERQERKVVPN